MREAWHSSIDTGRSLTTTESIDARERNEANRHMFVLISCFIFIAHENLPFPLVPLQEVEEKDTSRNRKRILQSNEANARKHAYASFMQFFGLNLIKSFRTFHSYFVPLCFFVLP